MGQHGQELAGRGAAHPSRCGNLSGGGVGPVGQGLQQDLGVGMGAAGSGANRGLLVCGGSSVQDLPRSGPNLKILFLQVRSLFEAFKAAHGSAPSDACPASGLPRQPVGGDQPGLSRGGLGRWGGWQVRVWTTCSAISACRLQEGQAQRPIHRDDRLTAF